MNSLNYEFQDALLDDGKLASQYASDTISDSNLRFDDTKNVSSVRGKWFQ